MHDKSVSSCRFPVINAFLCCLGFVMCGCLSSGNHRKAEPRRCPKTCTELRHWSKQGRSLLHGYSDRMALGQTLVKPRSRLVNSTAVCCFSMFLLCRQHRRVPDALKDLVGRCWDANYDKRPEMTEVCYKLTQNNMRKHQPSSGVGKLWGMI